MKYISLFILFFACTNPIVYQQTQSKLSSPSLPSSNFTVIHVLSSEEGIGVRGALVELDGRLYGLAGERGPNGSADCSSGSKWNSIEHTSNCPGSLFSLKLDGSDFKVEHAFSRLDIDHRNTDGYHPYSSITVGPDHRLYGVTQMGGSPPIKENDRYISGYGVLFVYTPKIGEFEVLHHFFSEQRAFDGEFPMGAVTVDPEGNVYGIAKDGGETSSGTVWKLFADPTRTFAFNSLPGFTYGGITFANGLLHGTTWADGADNAGTYFVVEPVTLTTTVVASFPPFSMNEHGTDNTPIQEPIVLSNHQIMMAREFGGRFGTGIITTLDPATGIKVLKSMEDISLEVDPRFSNFTGAMLNGRMAEGRDGLIYGVAQYGGAFGTGGIFRIARDGSLFQLLYSFPDAAYPYGGVTVGSDGAIYGTTFDTNQIWRFVPPSVISCE